MSNYGQMAESTRNAFKGKKDEKDDEAAAYDAEFGEQKKGDALKKYMKQQGMQPPPEPQQMAPEEIDNAAAQIQGAPPPHPMPQAVVPSPTPDPRMIQEQAMRNQAPPVYMQTGGQEMMPQQQNHEAPDKQKALGMYLRQRGMGAK